MVSKDADAAARTLAGRYRLGPTLGTGANAKSFDATDLEDGAPVVVKMLPSRFGESKMFMERFTADLGAAALVLHPNLARIKDFGVETVGDKAYPFVVTEQFVGGSLRGILDRGRTITASQALMVGLDVCRGLAFAHSKGLVHGAVTPSNVLFGPDRKVRLADFGISRLLGDIVWGDPGRIDVDMARYASPEHALGLPVGPKSDVYSLALTLVESVTGQVPFAADTSVATLSARLNKLMPVSADLGALASVLERAGRPVLEDRFSAVEFGRALVAAAEFMPRPEPIAVVGLGRFGDAAASLPETTDPTDAHGVDVTEAVAAFRAGERASLPPSSEEDSLELLRTLPDAVVDGPRVPMPPVQAVPPPPLSDSPAVAAPVEFASLPAAGSRITDEHGSPDRAPVATVIGEVAADWVPNAEPSRRASTIETVEGDDDVLNIDRRSMLKYVMSALALLVVAVLGVIGYRALSAPSRTVPNLIGMTEAQAANVVADNGWELEVRRVRDDGQAQGDVVRTDPASGDRLRKGDSLVLVVSDGPTLSALPNVTGLDVDNARSALSAVGLTMREAQQVASETVS
ncbi:MAG: protein kinase, partial [Actinobacteria bacterium]|nr:protein kinase [Actinomycetota bacterium]